MNEIRIPRLGWSMEQGTFLRWLKNHGDTVNKGDALFELEGEKNVQEIESVEAGILHIPKGSPMAGSTVDVGALLGYLLHENESPPDPEIKLLAESNIEKTPKNAGPAARRMAAELGIEIESIAGTGRSGLVTKQDVSLAAEMKQAKVSEGEIKSTLSKQAASPRARRIARENGIDWTSLAGSGRSGRIREIDVRRAIELSGLNSSVKPSGKPAFSGLSPRRRAIAERLRRSQQLTVPVTLHTTADVTELVALRSRFKVSSPATTPSYNDLVCALLPHLFKIHPQMAQVWDTAHETLMRVNHEQIHIGIAVDTPDGLLVPTIKNVANRPLSQITAESSRLIALARSGILPGDAMRGGCFTVTNLGAFGIDGFTPVINLPEIAILGLGAIRREPVFHDDNSIVSRHRMVLSLTFDHAAVDGAPASAFLRDIALAMADPAAFLLNLSH